MPRVVELEERRSRLAEAVWRVVLRDGLEGASVRTVAVEAGLSTGSLRHYFASQSELHAFAMRLVTARIRSRVEALPADGDAPARAVEVLEQLLPLDAERRVESQVWLAFSARALVDPPLRALRDEGWHLLREVCRTLLRSCAAAGRLRPGLEVEPESARLHALVDGLLLHGVLHPEHAAPQELREVLRHHVAAITDPGPP